MSDPLTSGNDTFVIFFEERIPSMDADFFAVRDRVSADVRANRQREAVTAHGESLRRQLAEQVKGGKDFVEAAEALQLQPRKWEGFTLREPPEDIDYSIISRLEDLAVGEVSPMAVQGNRGLFTLITERKAPEVTATDAAFEDARKMLMRQGAQITEQGLIGGIVQQELEASGLARDAE